MQEILEALASKDTEERKAASDQLAQRAEAGDDLTPAVPALGKALADPDEQVRVNVAWTCAFLSDKGTDVGAITESLASALEDDNGGIASNVCWALACQAKRTAPSAALGPLFEAAAGGGKASPNAFAALANALANEASTEATLAVLRAGLEDERPSAAYRMAQVLTEHHLAREESQAIQDLLRHPSASVRHSTAYALVHHAEHGGTVEPLFSALLAALGDPDEDVRKEAVWAVYCAVHAGRQPDAAELEALGRCLEDSSASVRGNAGIPYGLALLRADRKADHEAMLEDDGQCFGAAWATVDLLLERGDAVPLEGVLGRIQPGIGARDQSLRQGIAGAIDHAASSGGDPDVAVNAIQGWLSRSEDPVAETAVMGIFYKLRQLRE